MTMSYSTVYKSRGKQKDGYHTVNITVNGVAKTMYVPIKELQPLTEHAKPTHSNESVNDRNPNLRNPRTIEPLVDVFSGGKIQPTIIEPDDAPSPSTLTGIQTALMDHQNSEQHPLPSKQKAQQQQRDPAQATHFQHRESRSNVSAVTSTATSSTSLSTSTTYTVSSLSSPSVSSLASPSSLSIVNQSPFVQFGNIPLAVSQIVTTPSQQPSGITVTPTTVSGILLSDIVSPGRSIPIQQGQSPASGVRFQTQTLPLNALHQAPVLSMPAAFNPLLQSTVTSLTTVTEVVHSTTGSQPQNHCRPSRASKDAGFVEKTRGKKDYRHLFDTTPPQQNLHKQLQQQQQQKQKHQMQPRTRQQRQQQESQQQSQQLQQQNQQQLQQSNQQLQQPNQQQLSQPCIILNGSQIVNLINTPIQGTNMTAPNLSMPGIPLYQQNQLQSGPLLQNSPVVNTVASQMVKVPQALQTVGPQLPHVAQGSQVVQNDGTQVVQGPQLIQGAQLLQAVGSSVLHGAQVVQTPQMVPTGGQQVVLGSQVVQNSAQLLQNLTANLLNKQQNQQQQQSQQQQTQQPLQQPLQQLKQQQQQRQQLTSPSNIINIPQIMQPGSIRLTNQPKLSSSLSNSNALMFQQISSMSSQGLPVVSTSKNPDADPTPNCITSGSNKQAPVVSTPLVKGLPVAGSNIIVSKSTPQVSFQNAGQGQNIVLGTYIVSSSVEKKPATMFIDDTNGQPVIKNQQKPSGPEQSPEKEAKLTVNETVKTMKKRKRGRPRNSTKPIKAPKLGTSCHNFRLIQPKPQFMTILHTDQNYSSATEVRAKYKKLKNKQQKTAKIKVSKKRRRRKKATADGEHAYSSHNAIRTVTEGEERRSTRSSVKTYGGGVRYDESSESESEAKEEILKKHDPAYFESTDDNDDVTSGDPIDNSDHQKHSRKNVAEELSDSHSVDVEVDFLKEEGVSPNEDCNTFAEDSRHEDIDGEREGDSTSEYMKDNQYEDEEISVNSFQTPSKKIEERVIPNENCNAFAENSSHEDIDGEKEGERTLKYMKDSQYEGEEKCETSFQTPSKKRKEGNDNDIGSESSKRSKMSSPNAKEKKQWTPVHTSDRNMEKLLKNLGGNKPESFEKTPSSIEGCSRFVPYDIASKGWRSNEKKKLKFCYCKLKGDECMFTEPYFTPFYLEVGTKNRRVLVHNFSSIVTYYPKLKSCSVKIANVDWNSI